jgi:hypothetical protein
MKIRILQIIAASLALAHLETRAAQFNTVDDYQYDPTLAGGASAGEIAVDLTTGAIFSAGSPVISADGQRAAEVRRSVDGGTNWLSVDQFPQIGTDANHTAHYRAVATGPNGLVLAGGYIDDRVTHTQNWLVRRSIDGGTTWGASDEFTPGTGLVASCADIKVSPVNGIVYAVGFSETPDRITVWVVRKSLDGGVTWSVCDKVVASRAEALAIAIHPITGALFVVGHIGATPLWTVRKSADAGSTWTTVQTFQVATKNYASSNFDSNANDVAVDPRTGAIYVAGYYRAAYNATKNPNNTTFVYYWAVQRSTDGGATWVTVDTMSANGTFLTANGMTIDSAGNVFVAGNIGAAGSTVPQHWIVRKGLNGTLWSTLNDYQLAPGQSAQPNGIEVDLNDRVYVTGRANDASVINHWITRKL